MPVGAKKFCQPALASMQFRACSCGIFFVAVPSSVLGAKKEGEKKGESSC